MVGNGSRQRNLQRNVEEDDLEAEYGRGSGGAGRGGGSHAAGSNAYDGVEQQAQVQDEEEDEVEAVKQQMRFTKQESLASTRNALRIARETEETASGTLLKLGEQSGRFKLVACFAPLTLS